jgi:hypothetical protein
MSEDSRKILVSKLYNDEAGESHFIEETLEVTQVNFAPPAPPLYISEGIPAKQVVHLFLAAGYFGDFHPAPRRQFMTLLSGQLECSTSDGVTRLFTPGSSQLVEDTEGRGHSTRALTDCVMLVSQLG